MSSNDKPEQLARRSLERDFLVMQDWPVEDEEMAGGTSGLYEGIGRSYHCLNENDRAQEYFQLSAKYCEIDLQRRDVGVRRPDHAGDHYFRCATRSRLAKLHDRSLSLFEESLHRFETGFNHENVSVKKMCRQGSIFCLLFLAQYVEAEKNANVLLEIERTSGLRHPESVAELLGEIAHTLTAGDRERIDVILNKIAKYISHEGIEEFGSGTHPIIDIKDMILDMIG